MQLTNPEFNRAAVLDMSPGERLSLLREHVTLSITAIRAAALVLAVMEIKGDDLSSVPTHLRNMLRSVNDSTLLPEVITSLSGRLRQRVRLLPLADQRRIVDNAVVQFLPSATAEPVGIPAQRLAPHQVVQVFGEGFIRSIDEQRALLLAESAPPTRGEPKGRKPLDYHVDFARGGAQIGNQFVSARQLRIILAKLDSPPPPKAVVPAGELQVNEAVLRDGVNYRVALISGGEAHLERI